MMKAKPMKNPLTITALMLVVGTLSSSAQAQIRTESGLLLGVYVYAQNNGMRVQSTIDGYSAVGRLFPGDILTRATGEGMPIFQLRSLRELENAKSIIGPNQEAAVEFYRPGVGYMFAWVEFTPLMGPAAVSRSGVKQYGAKFKLESEKGGASRLFGVTPKESEAKPAPRPQPQPKPQPGSGNPFDRFNNNSNGSSIGNALPPRKSGRISDLFNR